jgi:peptidoglycan/LPS O-acetylase OafA/YrhL
VLLGLALVGIAWRLAVPETWQFSRAFLPNKAQFFALGAASVPVVRQERGALMRYGLILAVSLVFCATQGAAGKMLPPLIWTVCLGVQMLPERGGVRLAGWLLRNSVARYLGVISYCLYLVNEPVHKLIGAVLSRLADGDGTLFTLLGVPAATGLPILAAVGLHRYLEAPALRWGRSVAKRVAAAGRTADAGAVG